MAAMDRELIKAFRRIEKKEQEKQELEELEEKSAERAKLLEELNAAARKRKMLEGLVLGLTLAFTLGIVAAVVLTKPDLFKKTGDEQQLLGQGSAGSFGEGVDCGLKENLHHAACSKKKITQQKANWGEESRFIDSRGKPFNLHDKARKGEEKDSLK